jgi:hypothetical protein
LGSVPARCARPAPSTFLKPDLSGTLQVSRAPRFEDKLPDVAGLCLNPPEHAMVLSRDEKSQILAPNRTQPGLPTKTGCGGTVCGLQRRPQQSRALPQERLRVRVRLCLAPRRGGLGRAHWGKVCTCGLM